MSSIFHILPTESILKILKNVFFPLFTQSFVVFFLLIPQFPDLKSKNTKWIFLSMSCYSKRLVTRSRQFRFSKFCPQKVTGCKWKNQVTFLRIIYFQKSHICVSYFRLFTKLKRRMELVFTAAFLHTFSITMFLIKSSISFNIWGSGLAG